MFEEIKSIEKICIKAPFILNKKDQEGKISNNITFFSNNTYGYSVKLKQDPFEFRDDIYIEAKMYLGSWERRRINFKIENFTLNIFFKINKKHKDNIKENMEEYFRWLCEMSIEELQLISYNMEIESSRYNTIEEATKQFGCFAKTDYAFNQYRRYIEYINNCIFDNI